MRILTFILGAYLVLANTTATNASPLIFKATREVTSTDLVELGSFDASKYRQVRIAVKVRNRVSILSKGNALSELEFAKLELNAAEVAFKRVKALLESGSASRAELEAPEERVRLAQERVRKAQAAYDNAIENVYPTVSIYAVEGTEELLIASFDGNTLTHSLVIESPPAKISIKVFGKGTYKVFAWASL